MYIFSLADEYLLDDKLFPPQKADATPRKLSALNDNQLKVFH